MARTVCCRREGVLDGDTFFLRAAVRRRVTDFLPVDFLPADFFLRVVFFFLAMWRSLSPARLVMVGRYFSSVANIWTTAGCEPRHASLFRSCRQRLSRPFRRVEPGELLANPRRPLPLGVGASGERVDISVVGHKM